MNLLKAILKIPFVLYSAPLRSSKFMKVIFQQVMPQRFWAYYDGVFLNDYPHIHRVIQWSKGKKNPVIFDVGGGRGTTIRLFVSHLPQSKIQAFEPIQENFEHIKSAYGKIEGLTLHNCAAGSEDGKSTIHVASRVTSSSLLPLSPEESGDQSYLKQALQETRTEDINVKRLEPYLAEQSAVQILKLDVQGYELEVLKGCGQALEKIEYIVLEVSNHGGYEGAPMYYEIDAYLREHGFEIADLFPGIKSGNLLKEWDCIYKKVGN